MSKMSQLNQQIQDFAKDDIQLSNGITKQIQEYLNGTRAEHKLSYEARYVLESHLTGNEDLIEEREFELFRLPKWSELNALARIMLPLFLLAILTSTTATASGYHHHGARTHYHNSIKIPKAWSY